MAEPNEGPKLDLSHSEWEYIRTSAQGLETAAADLRMAAEAEDVDKLLMTFTLLLIEKMTFRAVHAMLIGKVENLRESAGRESATRTDTF